MKVTNFPRGKVYQSQYASTNDKSSAIVIYQKWKLLQICYDYKNTTNTANRTKELSASTITLAIDNSMLIIQRRVKEISRTNERLYFMSICYGPNASNLSKEKPYDYREPLLDHSLLC